MNRHSYSAGSVAIPAGGSVRLWSPSAMGHGQGSLAPAASVVAVPDGYGVVGNLGCRYRVPAHGQPWQLSAVPLVMS